jgi:hypothetical protein
LNCWKELPDHKFTLILRRVSNPCISRDLPFAVNTAIAFNAIRTPRASIARPLCRRLESTIGGKIGGKSVASGPHNISGISESQGSLVLNWRPASDGTTRQTRAGPNDILHGGFFRNDEDAHNLGKGLGRNQTIMR